MKKAILIALIAGLGLASCEKEDDPIPSGAGCECGTVLDDPIETTGSGLEYYLVYQPDCGGSSVKVEVTQSDWYDFNIGDEVCFNN